MGKDITTNIEVLNVEGQQLGILSAESINDYYFVSHMSNHRLAISGDVYEVIGDKYFSIKFWIIDIAKAPFIN